jgi:hypothetical protein
MSLFWSVGSSKLSDIIFGGKYIAEHHALLIRDRDRIFIEDLGSTFGTYVNGDAIKGKTELFAGDRVKLGPQLFHWNDYVYQKATEESTPIHLKDLFIPSGTIDWQDLKYILFIASGIAVLIPVSVPAFLMFVEKQVNKQTGYLINLMQYNNLIIIVLALISAYVALNLARKGVKNWLRRRKEQ